MRKKDRVTRLGHDSNLLALTRPLRSGCCSAEKVVFALGQTGTTISADRKMLVSRETESLILIKQ